MFIYRKLIEQNNVKDICKGIQKVWTKKMGCIFKIDEITNAFVNIKKYCDVTKYRSFQYRLLHNVIFLNDRL